MDKIPLPGESERNGRFFTFSFEYRTLEIRVTFLPNFELDDNDMFSLSNPEFGMTPTLVRSEAENLKL